MEKKERGKRIQKEKENTWMLLTWLLLVIFTCFLLPCALPRSFPLASQISPKWHKFPSLSAVLCALLYYLRFYCFVLPDCRHSFLFFFTICFNYHDLPCDESNVEYWVPLIMLTMSCHWHSLRSRGFPPQPGGRNTERVLSFMPFEMMMICVQWV